MRRSTAPRALLSASQGLGILTCLLVAACALSGCASRQNTGAVSGQSGGASPRADSLFSQGVKKKLYLHYQRWKYVDYRYGGESRSGVDCSGFIYVTYRKRFGLDIPRTTDLLADFGTSVSRHGLRPGDIVFFRTGFKARHVGIYLDRGRFMHSSKSSGVTISRLSSRYWAKRYVQARRVLSAR